ncbi:hypothetical protein BNJ_00024 [Kaumoebavirus]|uniref:hypothetical protein n=1 Tax=Kaumoebavirus TaxID=1859492 RepID=UPI0009C24063|nr:hypothetical protein BNJ_00024 [Kaumoebavirus]ARA71867.1 hypothetical protein BNJ_00024 [Kaumoebavirus]
MELLNALNEEGRQVVIFSMYSHLEGLKEGELKMGSGLSALANEYLDAMKTKYPDAIDEEIRKFVIKYHCREAGHLIDSAQNSILKQLAVGYTLRFLDYILAHPILHTDTMIITYRNKVDEFCQDRHFGELFLEYKGRL